MPRGCETFTWEHPKQHISIQPHRSSISTRLILKQLVVLMRNERYLELKSHRSEVQPKYRAVIGIDRSIETSMITLYYYILLGRKIFFSLHSRPDPPMESLIARFEIANRCCQKAKRITTLPSRPPGGDRAQTTRIFLRELVYTYNGGTKKGEHAPSSYGAAFEGNRSHHNSRKPSQQQRTAAPRADVKINKHLQCGTQPTHRPDAVFFFSSGRGEEHTGQDRQERHTHGTHTRTKRHQATRATQSIHTPSSFKRLSRP